jgi:hypothetical protein
VVWYFAVSWVDVGEVERRALWTLRGQVFVLYLVVMWLWVEFFVGSEDGFCDVLCIQSEH